MASINVSLSRPDDESLPGATTTYYGTAVEDSSGGLVSVAIDGQVINSPDLEETTLTIPADDFKEGRYRLVPAPSEGSISVYADGVLMAPEDWTVDGDYLVIPALSGVLGVSVMYSTHVVQGVEPGDLVGGSVALVGAPSGEVEAVMRTGDISDETTFTETYPAFTVDGDIITFDGIDNGDSSFSVSYSKEMALTFTEDNLIPYQTPTDPDGSIIEVEGALWIAELPDEVDGIVLETIELTESEPVHTETDQYVLDGSMLYIIADAEQYQVSYTVPITEDFMRSELTDDTWTLGALPENGVSVTMDGEAFADYTLDVQTLTFALDPLPEWQITITYDADVVYNGSTDDFDEGKLALAGDVVDGSVTVYVDNAPAAFTLEENVLTVSSLIKDVSEYEVSFTGLREDNIVELPTGPSVKAGETVTVQVVNGMPMVVSSAGSGDRQESNIEEALTVGANALDVSEAAQAAADEAEAIANAVNQHFWTDSDGVHITEETQRDWNDSSSSGYHSGANAILNALGLLFRSGLVNLAQFAPGGIALYDGQGNLAANIVAQFTENEISLSPKAESASSTARIVLFDGQGEIVCTFGTTRSDIELSAGRAYVKGYDRASLRTSFNVGAHLDLDGDYLELSLPNVASASSNAWTIYGNNKIIDGPGHILDINQSLDFHVYSGGSFDSQDYVCRLRPSNTGGNLGIWLNEVGTTNVVHYLLNNGTGRLLYRTSSDGGTTWSSQKGVRSPWTSLGSFTGSAYLNIDLTDYDELMVVAKFSSKVFAANLPKAALTTSNQEWWLGGGKDETGTANSGSARALVNVTTTRVTGVAANNGSSSVLGSTTFTVYAR